MKNKILKTFMFFAILSSLLITASFAAEIKEDVANYESDVYIIGSTRFDANQTITADMAANAGLNEAKVQVALKNDISNLKVTIYFYDAIFGDWYQIDKSAKADLIEDTATIQKIEDNLNIFFVEEEMKTVEVPYDGTVDEGSVTEGAVYDKENKKFVVPALSFEFEFKSEGAKVEVKTNVDKNTGATNPEDIKKPEIIDNNIASIGNVIYTDIYAAIEAAKTGETVKLLKDVELSKQIVITKEITLDFNGKTVTVAKDLADISAILVLEGGDLVITGNGTLNAASQGNNYSIAVWAKETGKATIKNGTFTNVGAKSKDDNGTANNNEMIYVSGSGVITIEDGTFIGNTENEKWGTHYTLNAHDASYKAGTAKIIVKGGTFTKFNPANNEAEGKETNFVAEGYEVTVTDNLYTVVKKAN